MQNETLQIITREMIKNILVKLEKVEVIVFRKMYSSKDLSAPINDVVDNMLPKDLDHALTQCERTLAKKHKPNLNQ